MTFSSSAMFAIVALCFLAGSATAQISSGYATYSNGDGGVCSSVSSSLPAVSMNAAQFANGAACGQCIQITGSGSGAGTSPVSTAPYVAVINNVCPECSYGDIDLQESGDGKYGISWTFVGCPIGGRKLIETSFQGDTTVYTGFAHLGKTPGMTVAAPVSAPEPAAEQEAEPVTVAVETADAEAEGIIEVTQDDAPVEITSEAVAETDNTVEEDASSEASKGHLEAAQETEDVVQTSRRLLKSF